VRHDAGGEPDYERQSGMVKEDPHASIAPGPRPPGAHGGGEALSRELSLLRIRHELFKGIRAFFCDHGYTEVETPNLMVTAPPDPNIDPLSVFIGQRGPFYLHTSPELGMKTLLQYGLDRIFQICKVYRVEENQEIHGVEFTMLEWYTKGTYLSVMDEVENLVLYLLERVFPDRKERSPKPWRRYSLRDLMVEKTRIDPFPMSRNDLATAMKDYGFGGIVEKDTWNDLFLKLFVQEVEPRLDKGSPFFIMDWPLSISTMAQSKGDNTVERFEFYIRGLEIANGYTELLDPKEQEERFARDNQERSCLGKSVFPVDTEFLDSLSRVGGPFGGVSVGVDRLLMALLEKNRLDEVLIDRLRLPAP
jgi:elongation factor P--(R)-beta-lysine ligase